MMHSVILAFFSKYAQSMAQSREGQVPFVLILTMSLAHAVNLPEQAASCSLLDLPLFHLCTHLTLDISV